MARRTFMTWPRPPLWEPSVDLNSLAFWESATYSYHFAHIDPLDLSLLLHLLSSWAVLQDAPEEPSPPGRPPLPSSLLLPTPSSTRHPVWGPSERRLLASPPLHPIQVAAPGWCSHPPVAESEGSEALWPPQLSPHAEACPWPAGGSLPGRLPLPKASSQSLKEPLERPVPLTGGEPLHSCVQSPPTPTDTHTHTPHTDTHPLDPVKARLTWGLLLGSDFLHSSLRGTFLQ